MANRQNPVSFSVMAPFEMAMSGVFTICAGSASLASYLRQGHL